MLNSASTCVNCVMPNSNYLFETGIFMIRILPRPRNSASTGNIPPKPINWVKILTVISFLTPGFLIMFMILYIPVANSVTYSQYRWDGLGPLQEDKYVEWANYERLYCIEKADGDSLIPQPFNCTQGYRHARLFREAINHTFIITGLSLAIQLPLAMILALMVGRGDFLGKKLFRTVYFIPYVFSDPITAILWIFALHPSGLINTIFGSIIPGYEAVIWLGDKDHLSTALYAIFAVLTWKYFGLYMILYMAALQGVPKDLEEAARIDGANEFNVLRKITLPLIGSTIRLTVYLSILGSLQQFVIIWIMTEGGPVGSTEVLGTFLFKHGIDGTRLGFGSAIAIIIFGMSFIFSIGYQWIIMRQDTKSLQAR